MAETKAERIATRAKAKEKEYEALRQANKQLDDQNQLLRNSNAILSIRVEKFDEILNKIERASYGGPLYDRTSAGMSPGNYSEVRAMPTLSRNERAEQREADLHEEVRSLSNRLTNVQALAQFAREHKA